jgi:hypothetical protein
VGGIFDRDDDLRFEESRFGRRAGGEERLAGDALIVLGGLKAHNMAGGILGPCQNIFQQRSPWDSIRIRRCGINHCLPCAKGWFEMNCLHRT